MAAVRKRREPFLFRRRKMQIKTLWWILIYLKPVFCERNLWTTPVITWSKNGMEMKAKSRLVKSVTQADFTGLLPSRSTPPIILFKTQGCNCGLLCNFKGRTIWFLFLRTRVWSPLNQSSAYICQWSCVLRTLQTLYMSDLHLRALNRSWARARIERAGKGPQ